MKISDFKTKKSMKEFVKNFMYSKLEKNENLTNKCKEYDFFIELINTNKEEDHNNISSIRIMHNPSNYKTFHCVIEYEDGKNYPIGFLKLIDRLGNNINKESIDKNNLAQSFRKSIRDQIHEFKSNNKLKCVICDISNLSSKKFHVDHIIKFKHLYKNFMEKGYDIPELECDEVNGGKKFKDIEFTEKWQKYHKKKAELRILCEKCNLSLH